MKEIITLLPPKNSIKKRGEGDKQSKYLVKVENEELGDFLEVYESK